MLASHKEKDVLLNKSGTIVKIKPGQFITGRESFFRHMYPKKRKSNPDPKTVWRWLVALKMMQNLSIESSNKYSIVKIINWDSYQQEEFINVQQNAANLSDLCPQRVHNVSTIKNDKNVKNKEKESFTLPDWIEENTWQDFKEFRIRIKAPLTARAIKEIISDLEKLKSAGHEPNAVLLQSIKRGWRGVFEIKDNGYMPKKDEVRSYTPPNRIEELRKKAIEREKYLKGEV
jgi:isocitrate dehydrogenase